MDKNSIKNFFFPPKCMFCNDVLAKGYVCDSCKRKAGNLLIEEFAREIKHSCFKNLDKCVAFYYYKDAMRDGIIYAKFTSCSSFLNGLESCIPVDLQQFCTENRIDAVISMPAHKSKFYKREYDLPQEMVKRFAKIYNLEYNKDLVTKVKKTKNQHDLSLNERKINLKDAFRLNAEVKGKNILIIDDIVSTGYSLEEVAKCLKKGGASVVMAVVFAYNKL